MNDENMKHLTSEEARALGRLIPVTEALPMNKNWYDSEQYLVQYHGSFFSVMGYWHGFNRVWNDHGKTEIKVVEAWMPTPVPYSPEANT